jgi:hypothetical protein
MEQHQPLITKMHADAPIIFFANQHCFATSCLKLVLRPNFPIVMTRAKASCEKSGKALTDEL